MELFNALTSFQDDVEMNELDMGDAVSLAMEFSKSLLSIASEMAKQAIQISNLDTEEERIAATERQVALLGRLFDQLQKATMGSMP